MDIKPTNQDLKYLDAINSYPGLKHSRQKENVDSKGEPLLLNRLYHSSYRGGIFEIVVVGPYVSLVKKLYSNRMVPVSHPKLTTLNNSYFKKY